MGKTEITGQIAEVQRPAEVVYAAFADLSNFSRNLPEEHREKVRADADSLLVQVQGFELGIHVLERTPFSSIQFEQYGPQSLFPFTLWVYVQDLGERSTLQLVLHAELNMMMKMMLGSKLEDGINQLTQQLAAGLNGQLPNTPQV